MSTYIYSEVNTDLFAKNTKFPSKQPRGFLKNILGYIRTTDNSVNFFIVSFFLPLIFKFPDIIV